MFNITNCYIFYCHNYVRSEHTVCVVPDFPTQALIWLYNKMAAMHENVVELHQISNVNANCVIKSTTECIYCTSGVAGGLAVQVVAPLCNRISSPLQDPISLLQSAFHHYLYKLRRVAFTSFSWTLSRESLTIIEYCLDDPVSKILHSFAGNFSILGDR